jgi:hypothetical protein
MFLQQWNSVKSYLLYYKRTYPVQCNDAFLEYMYAQSQRLEN